MIIPSKQPAIVCTLTITANLNCGDPQMWLADIFTNFTDSVVGGSSVLNPFLCPA